MILGDIGMYGGKFLPLHKGHNYCIETACKECKKVYVILFAGGDDEERVLNNNHAKYLSLESRIKHVKNIVKKYDNAEFALIDVSKCRTEDGSEDWDAETPLVRNVVGDKLDLVYSSEPSYEAYFNRAYPEATHRIVDYKRVHYPISGTKIRNMKNREEVKKWII